MSKRAASLTIVLLLAGCAAGRADLKYTESSKVTGGMMASVMKFAGKFSKQAREPITTTTYVKGHRMRTDSSGGHSTIIDLDGQRIISIDNTHRTYLVITFDQMRQAIQQAKVQAEAAMEKRGQKTPNVKLTPKFEMTNGTGSRTLLGYPTHEVKMHMDMVMESTDPSKPGQATMWVSSDSYLASSLPGSTEVREFRRELAKQLNWLPGTIFGSNPQMSDSMAEFRKHASNVDGFPLLQYTSMGMGVPQGASGGGTNTSANQSASQQSSSTSTDVSNPNQAAMKALGSMFGGFHRHKKSEQESSSARSEPPPPPSQPGSMMDMTVEVTSYSTDSLDGSQFEPPAGYQQIAPDLSRALSEMH